MPILFAFMLLSIRALGDTLPADAQFAERHDCQAVNYRDELEAYRAQGLAGICFAYTTADLVRQRTGQSVSPLDLAVGFYFADPSVLRRSHDPLLIEYLSRHPRFEDEIKGVRGSDMINIGRFGDDSEVRYPMVHKLEGGHEIHAAILANVQGLCSEASLPSADGYEAHAKIIASLEQSAVKRKGRAGPEVENLEPRFRDPVADIFNTGWVRYVGKKCKRMKSSVATIPVGYSLASSLKEFRDKKARGKISIEDQKRMVAVLDYGLDHHRAVAIGYDLLPLLNPSEAGARSFVTENPNGDGDHSSPVIGRRKVDGECQYLVRDSSGYDCGDYVKSVQARCLDHHLWLTETELLESFYDLVYLR